jgi:hypothetical protein
LKKSVKISKKSNALVWPEAFESLLLTSNARVYGRPAFFAHTEDHVRQVRLLSEKVIESKKERKSNEVQQSNEIRQQWLLR